MTSRAKRISVEAIGTAMLSAATIGSRIMGDRLAQGNEAVALLVNTLATGAALSALMYTFAQFSGAHFNPAVTFAAALSRRFRWREVPGYVLAQLAGAFLGVVASWLMFGKPEFGWHNPARPEQTQAIAELVATFGFISLLIGCGRARSGVAPLAAGAYTATTFWFTASTSFANPVLSIAKGLTATSSSIHPHDIVNLVSAQLFGAALASLFFRWLEPKPGTGHAPRVVLFTCLHDDVRSRMAAALAEAAGDSAEFTVVAATAGAPEPLPRAVEHALQELGARAPTCEVLSDALLGSADLVVTLGCGEEIPDLRGLRHEDWAVPTGSLDSVEAARAVRDELRSRVRALLLREGWARVRAIAPVRSA